MKTSWDVIVVGAGLSGLSCAKVLHGAGKDVLLLEAADGPGGRVRSFRCGEYVCDRGFQVLLDAYPEAQKQLDYPCLQLGAFKPGAVLMYPEKGSQFARRQIVADPLREPSAMWSSLKAPGSLLDKWRILSMSRRLRKKSIADSMERREPQLSTRQYLVQAGFSEELIEGFFSAWFGGILSDRSLSASSNLFESYYGALVRGAAVLPSGGMQAIPDQIAAALPETSLRFNCRVSTIQLHDASVEIRLDSSEHLTGKAVVLATPQEQTAQLLGKDAPAPGPVLRAFWFAMADEIAPNIGPWIALDGSGQGPVNHCAQPSQVTTGYAPDGQQIVVATVLGERSYDSDLLSAVKEQLQTWYGERVKGWRLIGDQHIPHVQPRQHVSDFAEGRVGGEDYALASNLWQCGDHLTQGSINGALLSGRRCAEEILLAH